MNRRGFLGALAATAVLDPEKLLWVPRRKVISIPRPPLISIPTGATVTIDRGIGGTLMHILWRFDENAKRWEVVKIFGC